MEKFCHHRNQQLLSLVAANSQDSPPIRDLVVNCRIVGNVVLLAELVNKPFFLKKEKSFFSNCEPPTAPHVCYITVSPAVV